MKRIFAAVLFFYLLVGFGYYVNADMYIPLSPRIINHNLLVNGEVTAQGFVSQRESGEVGSISLYEVLRTESLTEFKKQIQALTIKCVSPGVAESEDLFNTSTITSSSVQLLDNSKELVTSGWVPYISNEAGNVEIGIRSDGTLKDGNYYVRYHSTILNQFGAPLTNTATDEFLDYVDVAFEFDDGKQFGSGVSVR